MALFGNLVVRLGLDKSRFDSGITSLRGGLATLGRGLATAATAAVAFGTALATAAASGLVLMVKNSFESIDNLGKMADRLGIATEDLSALGHAANLAGVDIESLGTSLQFMLKNISRAAAGEKAPGRTFEQLGLSIAALSRMNTSQQLIAIAGAFERIKNPADKMRLALEVFGRSGGPMLNVLAEGESGLRAMVEEAERLGLTFSRVDAAKIEAANDAWARMKSAVGGVANEIAISLSPAIESMATSFTDAFVSARTEAGLLGETLKQLAATLLGFQQVNAQLGFEGFLAKSGAPDWVQDFFRAGLDTFFKQQNERFRKGFEEAAPGAPGAPFGAGGEGARAGIGATIAQGVQNAFARQRALFPGVAGAAGALGNIIKRVRETQTPTGALRGSQEALNRIVGARNSVEVQSLAEEKKQSMKLDKIEKHLAGGLGGGLVLGAFK